MGGNSGLDETQLVEDDNPMIISNIEEGSFQIYHCTECDKTFSRKSSYVRHKKSHEPGLEKCTICNMYFINDTLLFEHNEKYHSVNLQCTVCKSTYKRKSVLVKHIQRMHPETFKGRFKCEFKACQSSFSSHQDYQDHMNIHQGLKPYRCNLCTKAFSLKLALRQHEAKHRRSPTINQCCHCGKMFRSPGALYHHTQAIHKKIRHVCSRCNKEFRYKSGYNKHMAKHEEALNAQSYQFMEPVSVKNDSEQSSEEHVESSTGITGVHVQGNRETMLDIPLTIVPLLNT